MHVSHAMFSVPNRLVQIGNVSQNVSLCQVFISVGNRLFSYLSAVYLSVLDIFQYHHA